MKRFEDLFEASSAQLMAAGARRATAAAAQQRRMKVAKSSVAANQTINALKSQAAQDAATTPISKGGPLALRTPPAKERDPKVAAALKKVPVNKNAPATKAQRQFQQNKDFGDTAQTSASTSANKDTLAAKADRKAALQNKANQLKKQKDQGQDRLARVRSAVNSMAVKNRISSTQSDASAFGAMLGNIGNAARGAGRAIAAGTGLDKKLEAKRNQVSKKLFGGSQRPGLSTGVKSSGASNPSRKPADPWASSNKPADPWKSSPKMSDSAKKILNPAAGDAGNTGVRSSTASFVNKNKPKPTPGPTQKPALKLRRDPSMFKTTGTSGSSTGLGAAARKNPELKAKLIKQRMGEEYSNWREEYIFEVDKKSPDSKKKTIEPMSGSNQIIVNPTADQVMKEAVLGRYAGDRGGGKKLRPASERTKPKSKPESKETVPTGPKVTILKPKGPRKGEATASQVQGWRGSDRTNTNRAGHRAHAKTISADFEPQGESIYEGKKRVPTEQEIAKNHGVSVDYVVRQAEIGSTVEREHVTTHEEAYGIALQHIAEFPDYYKHLLGMEKKLKSEWKKKDPIKENHIAIAMGKELDDEGSMILNQLDQLEMHCKRMREVVKKPTMQVPAWVQSKITIATDYMDSVANYMSSKNEEVEIEEKRGLWDNIHAKRKRGERPAKPGEKGYPKTLDIEEGLKQARKNVGASRCWKNKKVDPNKPTKMKGGEEVPNCVPEGFVDPEHGEAPSGRSPLSNVSDHPNPKVRKKAVKAFKTQMSKEYGGHWKSRSSDPNVDESHVPGQPAERLSAVTPIPQKERDAARERTLAKAKAAKAAREKGMKEEIEIEEGKKPFPFKKVEKQMAKAREGSVYAKTGNPGPVPNTTEDEKKETTRFSKMFHASQKAKREKQNAAAASRSSTFYRDTHPASAPKMKKSSEVQNAHFEPTGEMIGEAKSPAWQRKEGKNPEGGLNEKGRKSYEEENPGSDLKPPQPEGGPRKRSFCARMSGMPGPMKDENGKPTRKALSLRKWHCGRKGG